MKIACSNIAVAALWLAACAPELPPLVAEQGQVQYFAFETHGSSCSADRARAVRVALDRLAGELGVAPVPVDYYHVPWSTLRSICPSGSSEGCTDGRSVWSVIDLHQHELVHVLMDGHGHPPLVLVEGLAEMAGGGFPSNDADAVPNPDMLAWLRGEVPSPLRPSFYLQSAAFVRFLLERYGLERLLVLYARLSESSPDAEMLDTEFYGLTGETASAVVDAWLATGARPAYEIVRPTFECTSEPLLPEMWSSVDLLCGARTSNFYLSDYQHIGLRRVSVPADQQLALRARTSNASGIAVILSTCGGPHPFGGIIPFEPPLPSLEAGRTDRILISAEAHGDIVAHAAFEDGPATVEFRAELGTWVGDECETVDALDIHGDSADLTIHVPNASSTWVRLTPSTRVEILAVGLGADLASLELYDAACAATGEELTPENFPERLQLDAGLEYVLRINWSGRAPANQRAFIQFHTPGTEVGP